MNLSTTAIDYPVTCDGNQATETLLPVTIHNVNDYSYKTLLERLNIEDINLTETLLKKARVVVLTQDYYFGFLRFHSVHNTISQAEVTTKVLSNDHYRSALILDASGQ